MKKLVGLSKFSMKPGVYTNNLMNKIFVRTRLIELMGTKKSKIKGIKTEYEQN
jgi:hypothetical protein